MGWESLLEEDSNSAGMRVMRVAEKVPSLVNGRLQQVLYEALSY